MDVLKVYLLPDFSARRMVGFDIMESARHLRCRTSLFARGANMTPSEPLYRLIPLTQGQWAIVDAADYDWLMQWKWQAQWCAKSRSFYAARRTLGGRKTGRHIVMMHNEILGILAKGEQQGDHRNHDTLDNRRLNLRGASGDENKRHQRRRLDNTTGCKGVSMCRGRYTSRIQIDGKRKYLGSFPLTAEGFKAAAQMYYFAADLYFGEFAFLEDHQPERLDLGPFHNRKIDMKLGKPRPQCVRTDSKTGFKRITIFRNKKYKVDLTVGGKTMYFGLYPLTEEGLENAKAVLDLAQFLYLGSPS